MLSAVGHHFEIVQEKLHSKNLKPLIGNKWAKIPNKFYSFLQIENIVINKLFKIIAK